MSDIIEEIKKLKSSTGEKGWPVAVKDRISYYCGKGSELSDANVAVTFLWTMRDTILPKLDKENLAIATNFYTPSGLVGMVRNILGNPNIRYIILLGEEYSSKSKTDTVSELTSANALRAFFEKGIDNNRKIPGFEDSVHFDKTIPTEMIQKVIDNVTLIDLNKDMPDAPFIDKVKKVNQLLGSLDKKEPFMQKPCTFAYDEATASFPYEGGPIVVHGSNIPKTWIEIIHNIYRYGRLNMMNANTDRYVKEINNMVAVIHDPQDMDLSLNPFLVPLTKEKIEAYQKEILSPLLPEGKAYTYGNKLRAYEAPAQPIKDLVTTEEYRDYEFGKGDWIDKNVEYLDEDVAKVNQVSDIIEVLKRDPYSKACCAITWHVADELMRKHKSSPCLVMIQAMVQDEKLNLTVYFRSHDMTQGWPENAYGCAAIQKEIADGITIEPGILTIISSSAQIYNHYYAQVESMLDKYKKIEKDLFDERGNFTIELDDKTIVVKHLHPKTGKLMEIFKAASAKELYENISKKNDLPSRHSMYLGGELMRAEIALRLAKPYEQDVAIEIDDKRFVI